MTLSAAHPTPATPGEPRPDGAGLGRRTFLGYLVAGTTLVAGADLTLGSSPASAAGVPTPPQISEEYDLNDALTDAARPTANLITIEIKRDGTAHFALPRMEVGQGITTSTAMIIAEELDLPVDKVKVTLAPARPELVFNQLTGGSNTTISTYTPIRVAAAIAKGALLDAAAAVLGEQADRLQSRLGVITGSGGRSVTYGELAEKAAVSSDRKVDVQLKDASEFRVVGVGQNRVDARDAVTGRKQFATDLQVPGALPTMVCRAPSLNGTPKRLRNKAAILRMPGVTHVAVISTGVAVRAKTFGQCIDAVRAMDVDWNPGTVEGKSDKDIKRELKGALPPIPKLSDNPAAKVLDKTFTFYFRSNAAMDTCSAIADVRSDSAEIWAGMKSPIAAQERIGEMLGLTPDKVTCHVVTGGGSFGRRLFFDAPLEAAEISKAMGKPVKLMWHRADDARVGRTHPMSVSRVQVAMVGDQVAAYHQEHASIATDYRHGLGELLTAIATDLPSSLGNQSFSQTIFQLTQSVPYNVGPVVQNLTEPLETGERWRFNTGSMRNIYSPDVRTASELMIDQVAKELGKDRYELRKSLVRDDRVLAVLEKVAQEGRWGRRMPRGTAQGIAIHKEYHGATAALVEIDNRPSETGRDIYHGVGGPRVTKVVFAIDAGLVINPRGLEAQMQGGINDGIALALTSSLHLRDGHFLEASWDNYFYTRQWNTPPEVEVHIMPSSSTEPGGAGEAGVAATFAATACAYMKATGEMPTEFPINHDGPLHFRPKPTVPPIPQSPTNGLRHTY